MPETYEGVQVYIGTEKVYCDNNTYCMHYNISYTITPDKGINIINGYETESDIHKRQFLEFIHMKKREYYNLFGKRTMKSLMTEWKAHNICYRKGWYKDRAKDVFLDANEKWYRRVFYWFVTHIFKEK